MNDTTKKHTKQEILEKFEDLIADSYSDEMSRIDNSSSISPSYYKNARDEADARHQNNKRFLLALEEMLGE